MSRIKPLHTLVALCFMCGTNCVVAFASAAQQWHPTRPLRMIVPFAPGGGADAMARLIQPKLVELVGQPVVIDNRAGASGNIGAELLAKSPPDGYTIMMTTANLTIAPSVFNALPFDVVKDFTAISLLAKAPSILAVHPALPAKTVKELIALAKASPGKLNYASDGGGPVELGMELFKVAANVDLKNVPYKSTGPAVIAVISGESSAIMAPALAVVPHSKSGRLRALAITSAQRVDVLSELPTVAESGVPKFEVNLWYGILGPAHVPAVIVAELNRSFALVVQSPEIRTRLTNEASIPATSTPNDFAQFVKDDIAKWAVAAKKSAGTAK